MSRRLFIVLFGSLTVWFTAAAAHAGNCAATFRLGTAVTIGALQYEVAYPLPDVDFDGIGGDVACSDPTGSFTSFSDDDSGTLTAGSVAFIPYMGPADVAVCDITAVPGTLPENFTITVIDASDDTGTPIVPVPTVTLAALDCSWPTTTQTSTTMIAASSTTMAASSTSTSVPPSTTSTMLVDERTCIVDIALVDGENLASLQFDVDYSGVAGTFEGEGAAVSCSGLVPSSLMTFNDVDETRILSGAIITLGSFSGPLALGSCVYLPGVADPGIDDFAVTVSDAGDSNGQTVDPFPNVVIDSIICFDPNATTTTSTTSTTLAVCGDGIVQLGEVCDDGAANSDQIADACRTDCREAFCGDNVIDTGESCDDGGANSDSEPDACRSHCAPAVCGDGVIDSGESCDDGGTNSDDDPDACRTSCTPAFCGDGTTDSGEQCDHAGLNSDEEADACRLDCTTSRCGDEVIDSGEECDNGAANSDADADACRSDCRTASCGDTTIDSGEECDDGAANSDADPLTCRTACETEYVCADANGDGVISATDANRILQFAVGIVESCDPGRCDTSGDGLRTVSDAQLALRDAVGLPADLLCTRDVTVRLDDTVPLGRLGLTIDYGGLDTAFLGAGTAVDCDAMIEGGITVFDNDADDRQLEIEIFVSAGIAGPVDIARCTLRQRAAVATAADLDVTVTTALDAAAQPVEPLPSLSVRF